MARKFYFSSSAVPSIAPAFDSGWADTAQAVVRTMPIAADSSAMVVKNYDNVPIVSSRLMYQFISPAIAAQTITGTMQFVIKSFANGGSMSWTFRVRVLSGDGLTVRGTLISLSMTVASGTPFNTVTFGTISNVNGGAFSITSTDAQDGDVIVVEMGLLNGNLSTDDAQAQIGADGGSDYTFTNAQTTDLNPWVNFSQTITMAPLTNSTNRFLMIMR